MVWEAAILAGGRARRLGGIDKSALRLGDKTILERQLQLLRRLTDRITIVGREPGEFSGVPVVPDIRTGVGALGGLHTAIARASSDRVLVLACDLPFVTETFLDYLVHADPQSDATVPRTADGLHPLCASYAAAAAAVIGAALGRGTGRVQDAIAPLRVRVVEGRELEAFDPGGRLLHNVNTPGDYERALRLLE